jgi:phosphatidylglycerol:prolipoprotein diacylglycerol transferase
MILSAITFPSFGITIDPPRVAFSVFGKDIYWYGIIIAVGFLLAVFYGLRRASQFDLRQDDILDMLFVAVPLAIIGARAYYCIFYWDLYADNPISCLYIWEGGLAIYGGIIGAVLGVLIISRIKKISPRNYLDIGSLGLLIGQSIGRWGNFINREAHGAITDGFFRMGIENADGTFTYYQPTFLFESLWNAIGFVLLHFYSKRGRKFRGEIFLLYVAWYGFGRGIIEGMRTDSLYLFNTGIRVSQLLGFLSCTVALGVWAWVRFFRRPKQTEITVEQSIESEEEQHDSH